MFLERTFIKFALYVIQILKKHKIFKRYNFFQYQCIENLNQSLSAKFWVWRSIFDNYLVTLPRTAEWASKRQRWSHHRGINKGLSGNIVTQKFSISEYYAIFVNQNENRSKLKTLLPSHYVIEKFLYLISNFFKYSSMT